MKILITLLLLIFSCSIAYSQNDATDLQLDSVRISRSLVAHYRLNLTASNVGNSIAQNPRFVIYLPASMTLIEAPPNCQGSFVSTESTFPVWVVCSFNNQSLDLKQPLSLSVVVAKPQFVPMRFVVSVESDTIDMNFDNNYQEINLK